jgi:hypothetical protein
MAVLNSFRARAASYFPLGFQSEAVLGVSKVCARVRSWAVG